MYSSENLELFRKVKTMKECFYIVKRRIFVQTSAEPNLFELCRVQPKITCV